jgi:hypothetical protein
MTTGKMFSIIFLILSQPVLEVLAQSPAPISTLHIVVKTTGDVKISKDGDKSTLKINVKKETKSKSYDVDGDYEIVTNGVVRETTVDGQHTVSVISRTATKASSSDCSGPCCLAGNDQDGYRCLRFCKPPKNCSLHRSPVNTYCSCD